MGFIQGLGTNAVFMIFLTLVCGYAFGRINFAGVKFGTSGVLVMALIFGALGMEVPAIIGTAGLALFLACVGLSAVSSDTWWDPAQVWPPYESEGKFLGLYCDDRCDSGSCGRYGHHGGQNFQAAS